MDFSTESTFIFPPFIYGELSLNSYLKKHLE